MKVCSILSLGLLIACVASNAFAVSTSSFEGFDTGVADWRGNTTAITPTWNSSGGVDGGYISTNLAVTSTQPVVFRANVDAADPNGPLNASNGAFAGDWLTAGAKKVKLSVQHNASADLTFLIRIAPLGNTPGVQVQTALPVPTGSQWNDLSFDLTYGNPLLTVGAAPPLQPKYLSTMSNSIYFQVAVLRPSGFTDTTPFTFALDSVRVVPEPTSAVLGIVSLVACACGLRIRRRVA